MRHFLKGISIALAVFASAGCQVGHFSMGSLSHPVQERYEISGASFDEAFRAAYRAAEEADLDIYSSSRETGQLHAGIDRTTNTIQGDSRSFVTTFAEFNFSLDKTESGTLVFTVESLSGGADQAYIAEFLDRYGKKIEFRAIAQKSSSGEAAEDRKVLKDAGEPGTHTGQVISEIRTGSPILPEEKYEFSTREIIRIQTVLKRLGYDPGPVNGEMTSNTLDAIKKFKEEYKILRKLFLN
jgi:hypothetical protein